MTVQNQEKAITLYKDYSKQELINELEQSRYETFKYVNKFLEVEEKWAFINLLLRQLNSIRSKKELCKTICEGFQKLTNSCACVCVLFNSDSQIIEFKRISYGKQGFNKKYFQSFLENVNETCLKFIKKNSHNTKVLEYFKNISTEHLIAVPIMYTKNLLGYMLLKNDNANFYNDNIHFINIFPEHIAVILENISLYQESERRNKSKIEFLAGISHEFKTPLNSIIGFAQILKNKTKDVQHYKYANNILQSSTFLLKLIEDVLDVSKSQYNSLELKYEYFTPKEEIVQILESLSQMVAEKNLTLNYTILDIKICADIKRFRQLIYNLVTNAIKFNKVNGKINILCYVKDEDFFFEITDSGDGISKKNYEKIFDFFSQVNRSQLKRQLGSGVGLALCKMIVNAHNGKIDFQSQIKKGSSFWFSLPLNGKQ